MSDIDVIAELYARAVYSKDEQAFLALYDEDVIVFDAWEQWVYEGREAWSRMVRGWFGELGEERARVTFSPIYCHIENDSAIWCATVRYAGVNATGEELHALDNRLSWGLRRRDGRWLIVHEHTSAPADFKTQKLKPHQN